MTKAERKAEFDKSAQGSVELARDTVQSVLKWTEFVNEGEFSTEDHAALIEAYWQLYRVVQPINEKYIDGEKR